MVPPSPPMNVQATADTDGVTVTWDAPLFMGGASSVTYRVYRGDSLIANGLTVTQFVDDAVGEGASASADSASYRVAAVNGAGESPPASFECVWWVGIDPVACAGMAVDIVLWILGQLPP